MSWRTITEDDVLTSLTGPETAAFKTAALKSGQSDPLAAIILTAVNETRGHIADCQTNRLATGATVPDRVVHHVLAIVRFRFMTRLGINVNEERTQEYKDARRFLERVSECKVQIEQPDGETEDDGSNETIEVVSNSPRLHTRDNLKGL